MTPAEKLLFLKKEFNRDGMEVINAFHDARRDHTEIQMTYTRADTFLNYKVRNSRHDAHIELVFDAFLTRRLTE